MKLEKTNDAELQIQPIQRRRASHRVGPRRSVLDSLGRAGVELAMWQRELPQELPALLLDWAKRQPATFESRFPCAASDLEPCLGGFDAEPWRRWLLGDMLSVLEYFVRLLNVKSCRVVFGAVRGDQCRKFHVDRLRLRLITTYVGPGTEWVPDAGVHRAALENPAACPDQANREIVKGPHWVRHARAGDVLVMKGALMGSTGVVHRSPPIERAGLTRVVLVASA